MSQKRPGRPRKEATEVLYCRVPKSLAQLLRLKAHTDQRQLSAVIYLIIKDALVTNQ